jgi:16S rRNA C1402 N4-methylase RsmH
MSDEQGAQDSDLVIITKRPVCCTLDLIAHSRFFRVSPPLSFCLYAKQIVAGEAETRVNPRARSAKLRVLEKRGTS